MWIVLVLTWALPWVCWPNVENSYWEPKATVWMLGCALLLCRGLLSEHPLRPWRNRAAQWLVLWAVCTGILYFWVPYLARKPSDQTIAYNVFLWIPTIHLLMGLLAVRVLVGRYLTSLLSISRMTRVLCLSAVACAVYGFFQYFLIDQFFFWRANVTTAGSQLVMAGMGNSGTLAILLAVTLPLCFFFQEKRYLLWLGLLSLVLWMTGARYAWVAGAGGLLAYGFLRLSVWKPRWALGVSMSLLLLLGGSSPWWGRALRQDERWLTWQETLFQWKSHHPWTGTGLESFKDRFIFGQKTLSPAFQARAQSGKLGSSRWHHPHSEPLKVLYDLGLIGLGLCAWMIGLALWRIWRYRQQLTMCVYGAAFISWLLVSLVHFPAHEATTAWWGMVCWAVVEAHPVEG